MAFRRGWHGVWGVAAKTPKTEEGNPGRSGGVAILVWVGRLILESTFESDHRIIGATLGWGRTQSIHIFSIYGFDLGQKDKQ
eukprot:2845127-Heterocapsa_arctica.AAC.1